MRTMQGLPALMRRAGEVFCLFLAAAHFSLSVFAQEIPNGPKNGSSRAAVKSGAAQTGYDVAALGISAVSPGNRSTISDPRQRVWVVLARAGIDTKNINLLVDGERRSADFHVDGNRLYYDPPAGWRVGAHTVELSGVSADGKPVRYTWTFSLSDGPEILQETPRDVATSNTRPSVRALLRSQSGDVDTAKTRIYFNGQDVSSQAQISSTQIVWQSPLPITEGKHRIRIDAVSTLGKSNSKEWGFSVTPAPPSMNSALTPGERVGNQPALPGGAVSGLAVVK